MLLDLIWLEIWDWVKVFATPRTDAKEEEKNIYVVG